MKMYKCAAKSLSLEPSNPAFTPSHDWNEGLEGYFRDSGFDQNTVRESGKR